MANDPPPPTVEYATPAREARRGSRTIIVVMLLALVVLAAAAGVMSYLLMARSTVTVQVATAPPPVPAAPAPVKPPTLSLPSDPLRLTLRQREIRALPGSKDSIFLHLDDITRGQVLLSATGADGTPIVDTTSVRQGDSVTFSVKGGGTYVIDVLELHNTLMSGDFAVLSIATPGKRPTTAPTTATAPAR